MSINLTELALGFLIGFLVYFMSLLVYCQRSGVLLLT